MPKNKAYRTRLDALFAKTELPPPEPDATQPIQPETETDWEQPSTGSSKALTSRLDIVVEIGRSLAHIQDTDRILSEAVELIWKRFGLYYAQVYLLDPLGQTFILEAGAGDIGKDLSLQDYHLAATTPSLLRQAMVDQKTTAIMDVSQSDLYIPSPMLPDTAAELAIPLVSGKQTFGILDLHSKQAEAFSQEQQSVYTILAGHLSLAIENSRLYDETHKALQEIEILTHRQRHTGWEDFLNAIDRDEHIGYFYDLVNTAPLGAPLPSVANVSNQSGTLSVPINVGETFVGALQVESASGPYAYARSWSGEEVELAVNVARQVSQHVDNLRLLAQAERYRAEAEATLRRLTREGWQTYLETTSSIPTSGYVYNQNRVQSLEESAVSETIASMSQAVSHPIRIRDETIGQVSVAQTLDEQVATMVSVVAERLSAHLENLRLLEETERGRQQLDKRAAELETVARVSTAAATILSPKELLQSVVDLTKYSFVLYHAHVYLLNAAKDMLVLTVGAGKVGHKMVTEGQAIWLDQEQSLVARAARSRTPVLVNDTHSDPTFLPHPLLPDTHSELAVPMIVGDQLLGIFDVQDDETNRFSEEDVRTYTTLAAQVSVALRNADLYAEQLATVERLRELDQLKSSFLANMSHELRTPLNSILGFAQVIMDGLDGPLTETMYADLQLIEKNGQHLLKLINDVLDMAKIEAGRLSLSMEPFDLQELVEDVFDSVGSLARDKSLYLKMDNQLPDTAVVVADRFRLRQIFINLIGNSIKFTEQGGITVEMRKEFDKIKVYVCDTGIGIPPNKLDSVFEAFSQVDTSTTRKVGGTGLGLPISRRLVELHNGRLWAESTGVAGEGSKFIIELPLTQAV